MQRIWSLARDTKIRRDILELCGEGACSVSAAALAAYRQDGDRVVGAVRAKRWAKYRLALRRALGFGIYVTVLFSHMKVS